VRNRWISLIAGVLIQIILGGIYGWSTFIIQLGANYGLTHSQAGFIFGLCITTFTLTMIFSGRILATYGPRLTAGIGAVLFTGGYLLASFSQGIFAILLLGLGIITGAGIGFGYVCPLTVGMKWFPKNKGLVTGISVAGFGSGAILLSAVASRLLGAGMDVLVFFRWWGIGCGSLLLIASQFLTEPITMRKTTHKVVLTSEVYSLQFWMCAVGMFAGTFAGLLINGNLLPIVAEGGLSGPRSLQALSLFAVGNAMGRIVWGYFFDVLGYKSIPLSLIGLSMAGLALFISLPEWLLLLDMLCIGFFSARISWCMRRQSPVTLVKLIFQYSTQFASLPTESPDSSLPVLVDTLQI